MVRPITWGYRCGGMWKNKHALVSAKKPKDKNKGMVVDWRPEKTNYVTDYTIRCKGKI